MKQLTITTHLYSRQLSDYAARAVDDGFFTVRSSGWNGGVFSINCQYNPPALYKGLMTLLADIAMLENPVYQHSTKLQCMARDLLSAPAYSTYEKALAGFLKHSKVLHLEGYVAFRMAEYREKLDLMSYSLIKKLKLTCQD